MKQTGRPTLFTDERWERILEGAEAGEFLVHTIARLRQGDEERGYPPDPDFPSDRTVRDWAAGDEELSAALTRARDIGDEKILADAAVIADDNMDDIRITKFGPSLDKEHVARSRLRIDTRLKILAIRNPRRYGQKVELSGDPDRPVAGKSLAAIPESELVAQYEAMLKRRTTK